MIKELIIVLILFFMIIIYFFIIEPRILKEKVNNKNQYGSARFSTLKEIKNNFAKEDINNINKLGVPIFFNKKLNKVWFDIETPHYVYLGSTGSGKSATAVIPLCTFIANSKTKRSVFITDPKGEIFETTSKMFKDNKYNVITIDFRNTELSNKINILEPIIREYESYIKYEELYKKEKDIKYSNLSLSSLAETNRLISSLSNMIMPEKRNQSDPFWNNSAKNLLEGIIALILEEYKVKKINRNQITMTSIRKFQNSIMKDDNLDKLKKYIDKKEYGLKSKDSLTSILSASENTLKSIFAVAGEKMSIFDDINVANIISSNEFDFDILGKEPTAIFLIVPDEDKTYYSLISIIVGLLYKSLVKSANNSELNKLKYEIDWILDEFANCPPLTDIESLVSVARSRGMRFHFFIQSFSQLENVYGKEISQIILDNCGLIYLKTNTDSTAESISKRLGKKTIESNSVSNSLSIFNYNGNKTYSLIGRDLMTADEIKQLHYKTIIFPAKGYPILRNTIMYDKFKCFKSGTINRIVNPLKYLDDTYFTVEDLEVKDYKKEELNQEDLNNQINNDKKILLGGIDTIRKVLNCYSTRVIYNVKNYRCYAILKINTNKINKYKEELINVLEKNYHLEFIDINNKMTQMELHIKNYDFINLEK